MRALASVLTQTRQPDEIIVEMDNEGLGAGPTRDKALRAATSEWVAFLDDDDELLPMHLERLIAHAKLTGADMVFPWFTVIGGIDPFPQHFGRTWSIEDPTQTTITFLVRREAALRVGGFIDKEPNVDEDGVPYGLDDDHDRSGHRAGEDFRFVCRLGEQYKIEHLPERTWRWHHWSANGKPGNTSGMPWKEKVA